MTLITIGNLTINLDNVAYWVVRPAEQQADPSSDSTDAPVITINFVGNTEPMSLYRSPATTFLSFAKANLNITSL